MPSNNAEIRQSIKNALNALPQCNFKAGCLALLKTLGYVSSRSHALEQGSFEEFDRLCDARQNGLKPEKAMVHQWQRIDILFQLTDDEINRQLTLGAETGKFRKDIFKSYLFVSLDLMKDTRRRQYRRKDLVQITREINKPFKMPVLVLFRHDGKLTLSIIDRRGSKRDGTRDVLEKVTLIKDIDFNQPHRAHIDILSDLSLKKLMDENTICNFDDLHKAWQKVLDIKELNKSFYRKLSLWFEYANKTIKLPISSAYGKDEKENVKEFVVRLICRTIFCWFLKEKGLINNQLLELYDYQGNQVEYLKREPRKHFNKQNSYYRGILENIFFACLNTRMAPGKGRPKSEYMGKSYLEDTFNFNLFDEIPYLNGGLFDKLEEDNANDRIDDDVLCVPNELFFAKEIEIGNKRTCGLNVLLAQYKFTVDENTPLEEEVALDPELLGQVFENLLAEADPDEKVSKSARRESGSYYTPRKIIDYMVNESLLLYLTDYFKKRNLSYGDKIRELIYNNKADTKNTEYCECIIEALDELKILDPACGSGAFPMGMLHRIVAILHLVDPDNKLWLKKKLNKLPVEMRVQTAKDWERHELDYIRKLGIIRDCIYGVDIQPMAITITRLRFFISLIIEQDIDLGARESNYNINPLPNLETKTICADSLRDLKPQLFDTHLKEEMHEARQQYYSHEATTEEKIKTAEKIAEALDQMYPNFAEEATGVKTRDQRSKSIQNKKLIAEWFKHSVVAAPFFNLEAFFPELEKSKGFNIVIGNPPYGGNDIQDDVKTGLGLGSKDPYGAFIARFLGDGKSHTPLAKEGILAYIVSDTFMTIKSHLPLRKQMMRNYIHKMIRVHSDTFKATVNTAIILCQRKIYGNKVGFENMKVEDDHYCQMVDLTNISIHDQYDRYLELLYSTEGFEVKECFSSPEYAIYYYPQKLIKTNSNLPFFVASPKLFCLMDDSPNIRKNTLTINGNSIQARVIDINGKEIEVVKLEQIADVKQGLATGDNDAYLFQNPEARGNYRSIEDYRKYLLTERDLEKIRNNETLRMEIVEKGVSKGNTNSKRYFGGRYIIPYDKGGESDTEEGWMPNYYVPTNYFIDWSEWAIKRMLTFTIAERIKEYKENKKVLTHYKTTPCAILRNPETYFTKGITFSITGIYAPSFRICSGGTWDVKGSFIGVEEESIEYWLGVLASKLIKYISKTMIYHGIDMQVDAIKEIPFIVNSEKNKQIIEEVKKIIEKQRENVRYDYLEIQKKVDSFVYDSYGLSIKDREEVENWYKRRYPKLNRNE